MSNTLDLHKNFTRSTPTLNKNIALYLTNHEANIITLGKDSLNKFEKGGVVFKLTCKNCNSTYVGQTGRLPNTRVKEHKNNFHRNGYYHNVLSKHKKENLDHDFDWENVKILHYDSNKCKREFMEMLYIKKEKENSINLKTDLATFNSCYDSMIHSV